MNNEGRLKKEGLRQNATNEASVQHTVYAREHITFSKDVQTRPYTTRQQNKRPFQTPLSPKYCDDLIFDSKGFPCCIANLEFPTECSPDNCPKLKGVIENERNR